MQIFYSVSHAISIEFPRAQRDFNCGYQAYGPVVMLQIFLTLFRRAAELTRTEPAEERGPPCPSDPMSHPALKAMSPRELADIPFPRWRATMAGRAPTAEDEDEPTDGKSRHQRSRAHGS
jgi:hypothetical protein